MKFLESTAILAAFAGAFLTPLERDVSEEPGYYVHVTIVSCTQAVSLFTVLMSVLVMTQMSFWGPREMALFTSKFAVLLTIPLVGMMLTLLGCMASLSVAAYVLADPDDARPWIITVAFSSTLALIASLSYPYMDMTTRATRFKQLEHEDTVVSTST